MLTDHGGNITKIIGPDKILKRNFIDFSSNINPLGIPDKVKNIIKNGASLVHRYPDPESRSARQALSNYLGVDKENILLANGSNELIHLIPRALNCQSCLIYPPTFSEYAYSAKLNGLKTHFLFAKEGDDFSIRSQKMIKYLPRVNLVILCNPNNPTGFLLEKQALLDLISACARYKTYLLVDEVFMEFVTKEDKFSLLKESISHKYLLVLRSLTKFFCLPGLRIGYLVSNRQLIKKINNFLPTWSVNALAQSIVSGGLFDRDFIKKTQDWIEKEREFLYTRIREIKGIYPYNPSANFMLCKILDKKMDAQFLFKHLLRSGIIIRDASNFKGLNNKFFRVAIRKRQENLLLIAALKRALNGN